MAERLKEAAQFARENAEPLASAAVDDCAGVASTLTRRYVYDNFVDDRDAQLVLRAAAGGVLRTYVEPPAWTAPIVERLAPLEG